MFTRAGALAVAMWLAPPALAGESVGVLNSGDCRDPDLLQGSALLVKELRSRLGPNLVAEDALRNRIALVADVSGEDLSRQIDAAQTLFYNGEYTKAALALERLVPEIRRFPPDQGRWALLLRAELLAGQVLRRAARGESDDSFRHVLRLQPAHKLDADYFMPSIRARFEKLRAELLAQKKERFEVSSVPPGADVYLDGLRIGTTPAAFEAVAADYEVVVVKDGLRSFPHALSAAEPSLAIDLQFEGSIDLLRGACLSTAGGDRERLAGATRVASIVGVDLLVVVHVTRGAAGPPQFGATVVDARSAQKLRYGELQLGSSPERSAPAIAELARFVVTGEKGRQLLAVNLVPPRGGAVAKDAPERVRDLQELAPAFFPRSAPRGSRPRLALPEGWRGSAVLGLGGGGVAAVIAGGVLLAVGNGSMQASNAYFASGPPDSAALAQLGPLREAARTQQAAAIAGLIAGGLALGASSALWITAR